VPLDERSDYAHFSVVDPKNCLPAIEISEFQLTLKDHSRSTIAGSPEGNMDRMTYAGERKGRLHNIVIQASKQG
jgi:hypothetical protein